MTARIQSKTWPAAEKDPRAGRKPGSEKREGALGDRGGGGARYAIATAIYAVSPDGRRIATAVGGQVALVDVPTGRRVATLPGNEAPSALAFSPDGHTLATSGNDRRVHLWSAETGARRTTLPAQSGMVKAVAFAPDSRTLASAGDDHTIRLWDLAGTLTGFLSGHRGTVLGLAFSPDGRTLASVGGDGACRLWQLSTGSEILAFAVADRPITHVAFSKNGRYLAFAGPPDAAEGEGFLEFHDCGGPLVSPVSGAP